MSAESSLSLLEPFLDKGIKNTNFFNGRLLTAGDLKIDQDANRQQHEQLGRALGTGVVSGLEVSLDNLGSPNSPPVVKVTAGLAFNPRGQAIVLPVDIKLALARQVAPAVVGPGLFGECQLPKTTVTPPTDRGIYLLVAAPASGYQERAPKRDLNNIVAISGCDSRYAVEGVQFRLAELKLDDLTRLSQGTRQALADLIANDDSASLSKLRNWLAHVCFGTEELAEFLKNPPANTNNRSLYLSYGAVDALREANRLDPDKGLTYCELPLALLFWTKIGVQFVDQWAVRRRPMVMPTSLFPFYPSTGYPAIAEAMISQFQQHIDDLVHLSSLANVLSALHMADLFRYLPPCGAVPMIQPGEPGGFSWQTFFVGLPFRDPVYIEGAVLESLYREALAYPPLDLQSKEFFWLYHVREIKQAVASSGNSSVPVLTVFARGNLFYRGDARINLSHWDYSNVALLPVF